MGEVPLFYIMMYRNSLSLLKNRFISCDWYKCILYDQNFFLKHR